MKIIACFKAVPEIEDIVATPSGELSFERAALTISDYDLNAIEEGSQLAAANDGSLVALSVGGADLDNSKLKKNVLSRGPEELFLAADDALCNLDTHQTALVLKVALEKIGGYDLIVLGEGSADMYAQQVGIQLGELLGLPTVNGITKVSIDGGKALVERTLEHEIESLELTLPAVICVSSDINLPRIPGMRELLAAGKKPSTIWGLDALGIEKPEETITTLDTKAPEKAARKNIIFASDSDDDIKQLIDSIRAEFK